MAIETLDPAELSAAQAAAWRALQAQDPDGGSPFLSPDWAEAVAAADGPGRTRVAMEHDAGRPQAFLAVRCGPFTALPAGAPLSDYQGVAGRFSARPGAWLRALGVQRFDFTHAPTGQSALAPGFRGRDESRWVDVSGGWSGVQAGLKARGSDLVRDVGKRWRRMEREVGEPSFVFEDADDEAFAAFVGWKRAQYRTTRQTDVLAPAWTGRLLDDLRHRAGGPLRAVFSTLRVGGRPIAGHLGLQAGGVTHAWFISHDPEFGRYSPGMVLIIEITKALAEAGGREFDLGPGDYPFKVRLCDQIRPVGYGFVGRPSAATALRTAAYRVRDLAERAPLGRASALPGKAMRRWDIVRALG